MGHLFRKRALSCVVGLSLANIAWAESFIVQDVRIEGLQRISAGTVFGYLPIIPGEQFDVADSAQIIDDLAKANLFSDIQVARDGNALVLIVQEYPVISEVNISGNKEINTKEITKALDDLRIVQGQTYNPANFQVAIEALAQQYQARSKYAVQITPIVRALPRGRVAIDLDISEGRSARIKEVSFVGNKIYSDETLKKQFDTTTSRWNSVLTKSDQYNPDKLAADIERLESFYTNRGFLNFKVRSTQVNVSPDRQWVYLVVNIDEGHAYTIGQYRFTGNLILSEAELASLIAFNSGEIYSRDKVAQSIEAIEVRLADEGYAQAEVKVIPKENALTGVVDFDFVIEPGERIFVRYINFTGNDKTYDSVLRREMRQMESSLFSSSDLARSEERLRRLPQIESLEQRFSVVEGEPDKIDIEYNIKERRTSYIQAGIGYGETSGALFNAEYADNNFFGTGNRLSLKFAKSQNALSYGVNLTDPYFTANGVSADYQFEYNQLTYDSSELSDWATDNYLATVDFGYPLSEYQKVYFGGGYRGLKIQTGRNVANEIQQYVDKNGDTYHEGVLTLSWAKDTLNSAFLPTKGSLNKVYGELTIPASSDTYYKTGYRNRTYFSNSDESLILSLRGDISYGGGYGKTESLPFYRHYYAGGISTVRGYKFGSLGPKYQNGDSQGGDFRVIGGAELALPWAFGTRSNNLRLGTFVDFGNVYQSASAFDAGEFRYSSGLFMQWISPIGPLNLSYAFPLNKKEGDVEEKFQFTVGAGF